MGAKVADEAWAVPRLWEGEACAILAGGPSLSVEQVDAVRASGLRCIAINSSYRLAPWADLLYFCDARFYDWHKDDEVFKAFGGIKATLDNFYLRKLIPDLRCVRNVGQRGLSLAPGEIRHGSNSGYQAINLAVQLGAARLFLFGYDFKYGDDGRSHWHGGHPIPTPKKVFSELMLPCFAGLRAELEALGVSVINCSPGSALTEFPYRPFDDCLPPTTNRAALPA